MRWSDLYEALRDRGMIRGDTAPMVAVDVIGLSYDSRRVRPGDVFVAIRGLQVDGAIFAGQALERGAAAIVAERPAPPDLVVPWLVVDDSRKALAVLASTFYGRPSGSLQLVGITGTNGKTTTSFLVASIFEAAGVPCGLIGTVGHQVGEELQQAGHTTPEAPDVEYLLTGMVNRGCGACAMEVSSHALALNRVEELVFAAGVFTNLTRDHLDFHADMESYFGAKRHLFDLLPPDAPALINVDDPRGAGLVELTGRPVTYAVDRPADITPGPLSYSLDGLAFDVRTPRGSLELRSSLVGRPNVYNILAATATATALGLSFEAIEQGVRALKGVPGRFQVVSNPDDELTIVVDYAHTDDALRHLLETARSLTRGRIITVFGCGGDRDRTKRPLMGAVAGRLSDVILITSDNPRGEDPDRIIQEIQRGITSDTRKTTQQEVLKLVDRRAAIARAVELATPGDLVLIAGKGHERYQVVGDQVLPFDDAAVAAEALSRRRSNSGVA